jgi:adenosine kinase
MGQLVEECRTSGLPFVYDPSQQIARMDGETLRRDMAGAYMMVINQYESNMVMKKTGMNMDELREAIDILIITHGKDGSEIYTNGEIIPVSSIEPREILDPTGAGDAYRAGFLVGLANDFPLKLCGAIGALNATYVLEHIGPQDNSYTLDEFIKRFRKHHDDEGMLDSLLKQEVA